MTRHFLDAEHYRSSTTFDTEQRNIFGKLWIFVGFTFMVAARNQFLTRTVAGIPVLVQQTDTGLRAFINQCPHRLSAIQTQPHGKRPLVCPYHAWSFDSEGQLRGVPNEHLYGFNPQERKQICLRTLSLETIGPLIFINLDADPAPLTEQFSSSFLEELNEAAAYLDDEIIYSCHQVDYNWKLAMENVKDHNHVTFVHPKSFSPAVAALDHYCTAGAQPHIDELGCPPLQELSYGASHPMVPRRPWFARHCETYPDDKHYRNWFIYPNVNFCCVTGAHFLLQQYEPLSATQTKCHVWIMTARRYSTAPDFTALLATLMRGERTVIAEDTAVLEQMQRNMGAHSHGFTHGDYETPLVKQHLWYRACVLGQTD